MKADKNKSKGASIDVEAAAKEIDQMLRLKILGELKEGKGVSTRELCSLTTMAVRSLLNIQDELHELEIKETSGAKNTTKYPGPSLPSTN